MVEREKIEDLSRECIKMGVVNVESERILCLLNVTNAAGRIHVQFKRLESWIQMEQ